VNKNLFASVGMSFDIYSRTTWKGHSETTISFFEALRKNGWVEQRESERLFCEEDGKFYADRYVVGTCPHCGHPQARGDECTLCGASYEAEDLKNPTTKIGGKALVLKKTTHWYIRLDLFKDRLLKWIDGRNWKPNVVNFVKKYIQDLRPRAITRDMLWGIPVPGEKGKVFYVWFDAPIGYISATKEWAITLGDPDRWKAFWLDESTRLVQFIGKDNIPFHAVIFPAMLMGEDLPYKLVDDLPANEFYTLAGKQFSKSEGWFVDLADFLQKYSADQLRYTIAANSPETQDSEFTWKDFQSRCNAELVGKFGNFIHRTLVFVKNLCGGVVPKVGALSPEDEKFLTNCRELVASAKEAYSQYRLRRASQIIMELAQAGNVYFDTKKPWKEAKIDQQAMGNTISCCIECVKLLALVSSPIIPFASEKILQQLGLEGSFHSLSWDEWVAFALPVGHKLGEPTTLFRKIEDEEIALEEAKLTRK
jgi:methionyl-tRNA synthetase